VCIPRVPDTCLASSVSNRRLNSVDSQNPMQSPRFKYGAHAMHPARTYQGAIHPRGGTRGWAHAERAHQQGLATPRRRALLLFAAQRGSMAAAFGMATLAPR